MQCLKEKFEFWKRRLKTRRSLLFVFGYSLTTTLFSCQTPPKTTQQQGVLPKNTAQQVVRIVHSKQLTALAVLEKQGSLEIPPEDLISKPF